MHTADASVYTDIQGLANLKLAAQKDSAGALDEVAQQFEALMLQMMLKSMRDASLGEGLMDSDQSLFYRDMYDQQLSIHMANNGGMGLTEVIKRQLGGATGVEAESGKEIANYQRQTATMVPVSIVPASQSVQADSVVSSFPLAQEVNEAKPEPEQKLDSPEAFLRQLWPLAQKAAEKLGQAPDTLLAQAALETGWGQKMIRAADGGNSHNLFGIKADQRWSGDRAVVPTLEFEQGIAVRRKAAFRSYGSFSDSFQDYANFLINNPRYQKALQANDAPTYLASLQESGYATDPRYAEKIVAILDQPETRQIIDGLRSESDGLE